MRALSYAAPLLLCLKSMQVLYILYIYINWFNSHVCNVYADNYLLILLKLTIAYI